MIHDCSGKSAFWERGSTQPTMNGCNDSFEFSNKNCQADNFFCGEELMQGMDNGFGNVGVSLFECLEDAHQDRLRFGSVKAAVAVAVFRITTALRIVRSA